MAMSVNCCCRSLESVAIVIGGETQVLRVDIGHCARVQCCARVPGRPSRPRGRAAIPSEPLAADPGDQLHAQLARDGLN